jgi:multidrug efflux pump
MQAHIFQFGDIDTKIDQPQSAIVFDHDKVAALGLDMQQVGADLSASIEGITSIDSTSKDAVAK